MCGLTLAAVHAGAYWSSTCAQDSTTTADDKDTVQWMVQNARGAAGLGMGVVAAGIIIIIALSAFGNVGLPKGEGGLDSGAAPTVNVEVRTNKKEKQKVCRLSADCQPLCFWILASLRNQQFRSHHAATALAVMQNILSNACNHR